MKLARKPIAMLLVLLLFLSLLPVGAFAADDEVMAIGEPAQLAALRALLSK